MGRLCERPGCSQPADVTYGIDADHLTVWIEPLADDVAHRAGVLCRRHADAMVVPLGWMLDDRRDANPRLFRPREEAAPPKLRERRQRRSNSDDTGQLELAAIDAGMAPEDTREIDRPSVAAEVDAVVEASIPVDDDAPEPAWKPVFDQTDDLGGLLHTRSPLLARAFGKRDRT